MPKVVATKPRRGVENTGRGGVRSIAEHETPVNCVNKSNPKGVTEFLSYLRHFIYLLHLSRGSFSATLRKRLLRRRASLRSTTCLCSVALSALYGITSYIIPMSSTIQSIAPVLLSQCSRVFRALLSCCHLNAPVSSEHCSRDAISMLPFSKLT